MKGPDPTEDEVDADDARRRLAKDLVLGGALLTPAGDCGLITSMLMAMGYVPDAWVWMAISLLVGGIGPCLGVAGAGLVVRFLRTEWAAWGTFAVGVAPLMVQLYVWTQVWFMFHPL